MMAGGARTATVQLITPNTVFEDRLHQVDVRLAKSFRVRATTIRPQLSIFNLFNAATVLAINARKGLNGKARCS